MGAVFGALGKKAFAFYDMPQEPLTADEQTKLAMYSINNQTACAGLEDLLVAETPIATQRRFLTTVSHYADRPSDFPANLAGLDDHQTQQLALATLKQRKGYGYVGRLIEHCLSKAELPITIVAFLESIHDLMKLPSLEEGAEAVGE